jgi:methyltransferase-like protein/ubiquinone/menaquinone biosynthesis C-methylase UbiE
VATLFGLAPARVDACRVLELGCGKGENLIAMAVSLPSSRFVGIDLSPRHIDEGQAVVRSLGLGNVTLQARSILDLGNDLGEFDYVVCHGVYSWVPSAVRDEILALCARSLAPAGIACISYNTYPGWHLRALVRELLGFHVSPLTTARDRIRQAREFLEALVRAVPDPNSLYAHLLRQEATLLRGESDAYLFHEHLEDVNEPVYFHQFIGRAAAHGLRYVADAWPSARPGPLPPEVENGPRHELPERIRCEQYHDFLTNRMFRATLLCHEGLEPRDAPDPMAVTSLHVAANARPVAKAPNLAAGAVETFRGPEGAALSTADPRLKAALVCLGEVWPRSLSLPALAQRVTARLAGAPNAAAADNDGDPRRLAGPLLDAYLAHVVELHVHVPAFVTELSERPVASALARHQAAAGIARVTNLRHRTVDLGVFDLLVLRHLDGSRDRAALLDLLADLAAKDVLTLRQDGQPLRDPTRIRDLLSGSLGGCLQRLAGSALLIG